MEAIFLWVPSLGVLLLVLHAAVPIHRALPWQDALANATPISPIPMDPRQISPIQMKVPHVPITLLEQSAFLHPPLHLLLLHAHPLELLVNQYLSPQQLLKLLLNQLHLPLHAHPLELLVNQYLSPQQLLQLLLRHNQIV